MSVTIVVPTWQRAQWLSRCLAAVVAQEPSPDEVVVVGRAGDAEAQIVTTEKAVDKAVTVRWVDVDRPGHVAPIITGLAVARGEIVAFVDDDAEPQPGWLGALLEPFEDRRVACVGGRVSTVDFRGVVHHDAGRIRWYGKHIGNIGALEVPHPIDVDGVMECNWAWRHDVLAGLEFDPVLDFQDAFMYGLDLCLQAEAMNWRVVYHPGARVAHHLAPRDSSLDREDRSNRTFTFARNYTYIGLKHFSGLRRAAFVAWWWGLGVHEAYGILGPAWGRITGKDGVRESRAVSVAGRREGLRLWRDR